MAINTSHNLRSNFSRTNYGDMAEKYQAACEWFESFGFNVAVTRLRRYKTCIDELAFHYRNGTLDAASFKRGFVDQVTSLSEAVEILRIHEGLASLYSDGMKDKLKAILSGKDGRPSPSDFDPARDTAFELLMAAQCHKAGLAFEVGAEADLIVYFGGIELFVECKRLKSGKKVRNRVKHATEQLHRRYANAEKPDCARGLLALSITDFTNPIHGLMTGTTTDDVSVKVRRHLDVFVRQYQRLWQLPNDKRTIGAFVELSGPSIVENENLFSTCHEVGVNNSWPLESPQTQLLWNFATRLAGLTV